MSQLASVSEGALGKLASSEMTQKAFQGALQLKDRVERMVLAISELDDRVASLEKRVTALEKPKRRTTASKSTAAKPATKSRSSSASKSASKTTASKTTKA
jgi:hypothetical protein